MDDTNKTALTEQARVHAGRGAPVTVQLTVPVEMGGETISELTLRPSARAFRGFMLTTTGTGGMVFEPYELARIGVQMASQVPSLLDKLDVADMLEVAQEVMGFLMPGRKTGKTA